MQTGEHRFIVSQTSLPDIFVIRYAGSLSASAIYVYLWINSFYQDKSFDRKDIYDAALRSRKEIDEALAELVQNDLLVNSGNSYHMTDIIAREVEDYIRFNNAKGQSGELNDEEMLQRNTLAESIQNTFFQGKMAYSFYSLIDKCLFEYKFEQTVVYNFFQEGLDRGIVRKIGDMKNLARKWYEKGIVTSAVLSEYKKTEKDIQSVAKHMGSLMHRRINELDLERIEKWVVTLHCSQDLIDYAYRCNEYRGDIQMKHVEDKLVKWTSSGITTVEEARKFEEETHKENKRKSVKRKARYSGAVTGAEAGIVSSDDEDTKPKTTTPEEDKPAFGTSGDDDNVDISDIFEMFGGEDD